MINYFAYGSCTNLSSFKDTMKKGGFEDNFSILGVGVLNDYKLAFTRKLNSGTGALDIIESKGDYVLGVIYVIPDVAKVLIDRREGSRLNPPCYNDVTIKVKVDADELEALTYVVNSKFPQEICPSPEYYERVFNGMLDMFPPEYINKYLIEHCNDKFGSYHKRLV